MRNSFKEKVVGALGGLGIILWYVLAFILTFIPLIMLRTLWWVDILVLLAIVALPIIGDFVLLGVWIWAFFIVIKTPFDIWVLFYIVGGIIYIFTRLIPFVQFLFSKRTID